MPELPKTYDPKTVEPAWAERWANEPFVAAAQCGRPPFTIVMPPPNVTGSLHMGHALDSAIQDGLIRYKRMRGYEALWLPGTDHAGIATQVMVERLLASEGKSRHALGRERFLERVREWQRKYGGRIQAQLKRMGASADWSREAFSMDAEHSRAVRYAFVKYYHQGFAYRGRRLVNWDPASETTLSDLEVNNVPTPGRLFTLRYSLEQGGFIEIATVRPETIFADQAIAVHPDDPRYSALLQSRARIPLTDRWIPILADQEVEIGFGTGALKVTPAHDATDFEIGRRHNLEAPSVIDLKGHMEHSLLVPEAFRGIERFAAREVVAKALSAQGFLVKSEDYTINLAVSDRTGVPVEPILSEQWFLHMEPLAKPVIEALESGEIHLVPERWAKVNLGWLHNIRDWNISRQLWWGHQIPAWHCRDCGKITVPELEHFEQDPTHCAACNSSRLQRDPDVFDTWFSSALWPFSTLGWPGDTEDLKTFYPTDTLVTGYDILFFWVARMEMSGLHFMGRAPFKTVLLHGLVLDEQGQKMSKSKGNTVDPLELVEAFGADATRFALIHLATGGQDIRFDRRWLEMGRNFANKLWNAARFVLMSSEGFETRQDQPTIADRWFSARLSEGLRAISGLYDQYELALAAREVYQLIWSEFCDWYIEAAKPALRAGNVATLRALGASLEALLKILHPFMPFITSELYAYLRPESPQIAGTSWPSLAARSPEDAGVLEDFTSLREAIVAIRSLRAELGISPQQAVAVEVAGPRAELLLLHSDLLGFLAKATLSPGKPARALSLTVRGATLFLRPEGLVDLDQWLKRRQKQLGDLEKQITAGEKKLADPGFSKKAPPEIVEGARKALEQNLLKAERIEQDLARFS